MDWITISAIVIPAIVSTIAIIATSKNNKANIQARRSEIAFDKRLEAFREIVMRWER